MLRLKCLSLLMGLLLLSNCGSYEFEGKPGEDGKDGKSIVGPTGPAGAPADLCTVSETGLVSCPNGSSFQIPKPEKGDVGDRGEKGDPGDTIVGTNGTDGTSCSVAPAVNGAIISCTDGTSAAIMNGIDGSQGPAGQNAASSPYLITEIIDPCGDESGFDEVLLRLANNTLLAHYSHGSKQFLAIIGPGNYISTDGHSCNFTVNSDMEVSW